MSKNNSYQNYYKNKIGSANINIQKAIAGDFADIKIVYKTGKFGLDESGLLKVLFRIATDMGRIQFTDKKSPNYVSVTSNNKKTKFQLSNDSNGHIGKQGTRPWSQGFTIHINGAPLIENDEIVIEFSKLRMQTYTEKEFEFRLLIDLFASAKFIRLEQSPVIEIVPGKPEKVRVILPSSTIPGKDFNVFSKLEDKYGNICTNYNGSISLRSNNELCDPPDTIEIINGKGATKTSMKKPGICTITGRFDEISNNSNPMLCKGEDSIKYYWADLHGQTNESVGTNSINDYFDFAQNSAYLDITCHQANDFQVTNDFWKKINKLTQSCNESGKFIAFPGYEWSGNSSLGGDHNVIYRNEGTEILRSSHALIDDFDDIETDAESISDLIEKLNMDQTILIAHAGGRYANLQKYAPKTKPDAIEIHSFWGTFEWLLQDAFSRNMRVGIVANSDDHRCTPGASYPGIIHFGHRGGLTCVRAKSLNREEIFEAIKNRRTYATTGERILLDYSCKEIESGKIYEMGELAQDIKGQLHFNVSTTTKDALERIELIQKEKVIYTHYPELEKKDSKKVIKISYSGAMSKGRSRKMKWIGKIQIQKNNIEKIRPINFFHENDYITSNSESIEINGTTTGGNQGCIIHLKNSHGNLLIKLNGQTIKLNLEELNQRTQKFKFEGLNSFLEISEVNDENGSTQGNFSHVISAIPETETPYFVKVIQVNDHKAWSSPIYISQKMKV